MYTFLRGGAVSIFLDATLDFDIADGRMERRRSLTFSFTSDIYHVVAATLL